MAENGVVDSLSIEIGASSTIASNEVKKLANSLKSLKESVNNFKIGNFKKEIGKLGGTEINKITKLADALKGLKGLNISAKLGDNFANLAAGLDLLEQSHIDRLEQFTQAMQGLKDSRNLSIGDKLPNQLTNLAEAVSKVSSDTVKRLDEMTAAIERLKGIDLRGFASAVKEAQKASGKATSLVSVQSNSALATVQNATDKDILDMVTRDFGASSTEASRLYSIIKSIPKECEKLSPLMKSFGNALRTATGHAANLAKNILKFAGKTFKNIWDKSAFKGLEKSLSRIDKVVSSFGRIAFYRAIRSAIKYVTDALKEGTENAYHFAQEFGDATHYIAEAYDEMASANFKMSNQLGAAWSTLIAAIEPIILRIIALVTRAADAVTQLFALLSGKGTYMKAVDYNKQWADSAAGAAGAAKEWKNQLMGFDEINRLEAPSDGGGGGGGAIADFGNMFEEAPIEGFLADLKRAIENGGWAQLGKMLGDKFNELVDSVPWAEFGQKLGKNFQAAVTALNFFLKAADFVNLGKRLAEFINNAIANVDFSDVGKLYMRLKLVLWKVIYGAICDLNWKQIAISLSNFIKGALNELASFLRSLDPKEIAEAIRDFFSNIDAKGIASALKEVLKAAFDLLKGVIKELIPADFGKGIGDGLKKGLGDSIKNMSDWQIIIVGLIAALGVGGLIGAISSLAKTLTTVAFLAIGGFSTALASISPTVLIVVGVIGVLVVAILELVKHFDDIKNGIAQVKESITSAFQQAADDLRGDWERTKQFFSVGIESVKQMFLNLKQSISETFHQAVSELQGDINRIKSVVQGVVAQVKQAFANIKEAVLNVFNGLRSAVANVINSILSMIQRMVSAVQNAFSWLGRLVNLGGAFNIVGSVSIPQYASGGIPEDGLFMANHGELVGKFLNGKTAVANNQEITDGIARAVYGAFISALADTESNSGNKKRTEFVMNINGREFARAVYEDMQSVTGERGERLIVG